MVILSNKSRILTFAIATVFALIIAHVATNGQVSNTTVLNSPYKNKKLSAEELKKIIQDHAEWLRIYKDDFFQHKARIDNRLADLNGVDLSGVDLSGVDLSGADLSGANLMLANLSRANLGGAILMLANLSGANLMLANLSGANLSVAYLKNADLTLGNLNGVDLSRADLMGANLKLAYLKLANLNRANLMLADLSGANLSGANLSKANLDGAYLSNVNLSGADLSGATMAGSNLNQAIGDISFFLGTRGLSKIIILDENLTPIVDLRKRLKEAGLKDQEKSLTSLLRKKQLTTFGPRYLFETYLLGGALTDFGANPADALKLLVGLIFVFIWLYLLALARPRQMAGIWRIRPENRLIRDVGESDREHIKWEGCWRSLRKAFYFSFLSAFHFGWKELNISNWIVRIQKKEYTLQATGWVRTVSGIQSLISLYLVALFLLTYFGNLFE